MDELIKAIVVPLVDYPNDIQLSKQEDAEGVTYVLTVNKQDMGKVIGKKGRVAKAVRAVVRAAGKARHENVQLLIRE
ncbi:KH domain-containing protein [Terrilactibacillus sp. S3-3]|nr:KH domain-containing protein [Terrilactibacillus sp. S3-3]